MLREAQALEDVDHVLLGPRNVEDRPHADDVDAFSLRAIADALVQYAIIVKAGALGGGDRELGRKRRAFKPLSKCQK